MVKWQNPFKRKKPLSFDDQELARETRIEAGFSRIKGTEYLRKRIEYIQTPFDGMIEQVETEIQTLLNKNPRTPQDEALINELNGKLFNLYLHKTNKMVAVAWSASGENRDMSERYAALEEFFGMSWSNEADRELLMNAELFMLDISFREKHGEPSPEILVQSIPQQGRGINLNEFAGTLKTETVSPDKD